MSVSEEEFSYVKLIAAVSGLAVGKGLYDNVTVKGDIGRKFQIIKVLDHAQVLQGDFAEDHVDHVKAAFAKCGLAYPGNDIDSWMLA
jgi:hypothetical protein